MTVKALEVETAEEGREGMGSDDQGWPGGLRWRAPGLKRKFHEGGPDRGAE